MIEEEIVEDTTVNNSFNEEGLIVTKVGSHKDPRQELCWNFYVESVASGVPNIKNSAMKAGYTEYGASDVGRSKWFKDKLKTFKRSSMLGQAEKNLEKILKMKYTRKVIKGGVEYEEIDPEILRVVIDVSKAIVKTLGKDEGYSDRQEITGKKGEPIVFMPAELINKHNLE